MNEQELAAAAALFNSGKYAQVPELCATALSVDAFDTQAFYLQGMSLILSGRQMDGLRSFMLVLQAYMHNPERLEPGHKCFVAKVALQAAQLAEFIGIGPLRKETSSLSIAAAKVAGDIAFKIGENDLQRQAVDILRRVFTCEFSGKKIHYLKPVSPYMLQIEPTNNCNLRCGMCPYLKMTRPKGYLQPEVLKEILAGWSFRNEQLSMENILLKRPLKMNRPGGVKLFFMGEPLLHSGLAELIGIARQSGCDVGIQTNGLLLANKDIRRKLLEAGPSGIAVSLDGMDEQTYEKIRKGSKWEIVRKGIEEMAKDIRDLGLSGKINTGIATIVSDSGEESFSRARDFLSTLRPFVKDIQVLLLDKKYNGAFLDKDGGVSAYDRGSEGYQASAGQYSYACEEPWQKLNVLWDGTVIPCCNDINGQLNLGDYKQGIDNIWRSEKMDGLHRALLQKTLNDYPFCKACCRGDLESSAAGVIPAVKL